MTDRRMIQLAADPVRLRILAFLNERPAGVSEVAAECDLDVPATARHLDALHNGGLIEVVGEVLNRGAVEQRYRPLVRAGWNDDEWALLDREEQQRLMSWIMGMIEADARTALEQGTFISRQDVHASRTISVVDEQGWSELTRIKQRALDSIFEVQAASAERLAESGEEGIPALSALLCFEMPPRGRKD